MRKNYPGLKQLSIFMVIPALVMSLAACGGPASPTGGVAPSPTGKASPSAVASPTSPLPSPPASPTGVPTPTASKTPPVTPSPTPTNSGTPAIRIIAPSDYPTYHTVVIDQVFKISVQVSGFKLVDKIGQAAVPGEGHIIYYVDAEAPKTPGVSAVSAGGSYVTSATTSIVWSNLPEGAHNVTAQLVNNDNTPLSQPVIDTVQTFINYDLGDPNIKIITPIIGTVVPAGNVTVQLSIRDFTSVMNPNKDNAPDEGHIVYYMDVEPPIVVEETALTANGTYARTAATSYTWQNVTPGVHTFAAQLVNNDDTPIAVAGPYPQIDKIWVTVQ